MFLPPGERRAALCKVQHVTQHAFLPLISYKTTLHPLLRQVPSNFLRQVLAVRCQRLLRVRRVVRWPLRAGRLAQGVAGKQVRCVGCICRVVGEGLEERKLSFRGALIIVAAVWGEGGSKALLSIETC